MANFELLILRSDLALADGEIKQHELKLDTAYAETLRYRLLYDTIVGQAELHEKAKIKADVERQTANLLWRHWF